MRERNLIEYRVQSQDEMRQDGDQGRCIDDKRGVRVNARKLLQEKGVKDCMCQ